MYYRAREQVLAALKKQAMRVQGLSETDFRAGRAQGGLQGTYSLCSLQNNLYAPPDAQRPIHFSDRREVQEKMAYLGSSAALLYNLLADDLQMFGNAFYRQRLRTLRSKNACTTVDAILFSETGDACVCLDAKLLEWFVYRVNPLRDAFLHAENYAEPAAAVCFPETFALLILRYQADAYEHVGSLRYYDGFFVLRQLLSLYHTIWEQRSMAGNAVLGSDAGNAQSPDFRDVRCLTYTSVYWRLRHAARLGYAGLKIDAAAKRMEQEAAFFRDMTASVAKLFRETLDIDLVLRLTDMWTFLEAHHAAPAHAVWMQRYAI